MHKLEKWNMVDTDWMRLSEFVSFPRVALVVIHKSFQDRHFVIADGMTTSDVGRNKPGRRKQGRAFPAVRLGGLALFRPTSRCV